MRRTFRRYAALLSVIMMIGSAAQTTFAWGPEGHRIVALIATEHLTPAAQSGVEHLLGNDSLDSVANFADVYRTSHQETANWHFVDIPEMLGSYKAARDCREDPEKGDCIIAAIQRFSEQVVDSNVSAEDRTFALKFLVHLIGDLHQPLHCSDNNDRGGNDVKVKWFNQNSNLHSVWDGAIIRRSQVAEKKYAELIDQGLTPKIIAQIQTGGVLDWALESHRLARTNAYNIPANHRLNQGYYNTNVLIVNQQLEKAGLRLAGLLNALFKA